MIMKNLGMFLFSIISFALLLIAGCRSVINNSVINTEEDPPIPRKDVYELLDGSSLTVIGLPYFTCGSAGMRKDASILSNGQEGIVMYGPYMNIRKGEYQFQADIELIKHNADDIGFVDFVWDYGRTKLTSVSMFKNNFVNNKATIRLSVFLEEDVTDFEYRIWASNGTILKINQVRLEIKNSPINEVIQKTYDTLSAGISRDSKIAIVSITSENKMEAEYIIEELTVLFVNSKKYIVVDRRTLDSVKEEQHFQMSGEVSDAFALSIGQFLGANMVLSGSITGQGEMKRLRIKALNVLTAQVVVMSSEGM